MTWPLVTRAEWGAKPPNHDAQDETGLFDPQSNPAGYLVYPEPLADWLNTIIIHHSAMNAALYDTPAIQRLHMGKRGFADIAYHLVIDPAGTLYEGRPLNVRGAHTRAANTGTVGVVLLGKLHRRKPPPAQLDTLHVAVAHLHQTYPGITHLAGHYQFNKDSVCPGRHMRPRLRAIAGRHGLRFGTGGYVRPPWA